MSESKSPDPKPEHKAAEPKAAPVLGRASESGDPAVHQILAELGSARSNGDDAAVKALTGKLADLGFE